jgi:2-dehydropantoate 2-reductase
VIAVLGAGGVGGFVAAALARAGSEVVVVAREPTAAYIGKRGIDVESVALGSFSARPRALIVLRDPVDVLLVTTKGNAVTTALERIEAEPELVVPLLNGLEHLQLLRERFGDTVAAGVIRIESDRPEPGRIVQTSPALRIDLATENSALRPKIEPLAAQFRGAAIPVRIEASEAHVLWSKLVRLVALACTTSAADRSIGFIRSDAGWRRRLVDAIGEAAAVAEAEGATIEPSATLAELDEAHPELGSSMRRDLASGRDPELDAIAGAVLRAGARHGIRCPTIERLAAQIAERAGVPAPKAAA